MKSFTLLDLIQCALCAALMAVCAWISIPIGEVPVTLQTFAIFLTLSLLGGKKGLLTVAVYILLGAVGVPVFSSMRGGVAILAGPTGGYILGFLGSALVYWVMETLSGHSEWIRLSAMILGNLVCYAFGTGWFLVVMSGRGKPMGLVAALSMCVIPYILPDIAKIALANVLAKRLRQVLRLQ